MNHVNWTAIFLGIIAVTQVLIFFYGINILD